MQRRRTARRLPAARDGMGAGASFLRHVRQRASDQAHRTGNSLPVDQPARLYRTGRAAGRRRSQALDHRVRQSEHPQSHRLEVQHDQTGGQAYGDHRAVAHRRAGGAAQASHAPRWTRLRQRRPRGQGAHPMNTSTVVMGRPISMNRSWRAVVFAACLALAGLAQAAQNAKFDPRDLNGSWNRYPDTSDRVDRSVEPPPPDLPPPPLKAPHFEQWQARQKAVAEANARGEPPVTNYVRCIPDGMPAVMSAMFPMEILQSPGRVTIIQEAYNQVRRIYLDQKQLPIEDAEPGFWGHSVARWEGDTLVVDTVGIKENVRFRDVPHSNQMRISERLRLKSADRLENQ